MRPARTLLAVAVGSAVGIGFTAASAYAAPPAQHPPTVQQHAADTHQDLRDVAQDRGALEAHRADIARDQMQRQTDLRELQAAARSHDRAAMLEERGELRAAAYDRDRGAMLQDHDGLRRSDSELDREQVALGATRSGRDADLQGGRRDVDARSAAAQQADWRADEQQLDAQRQDLTRDRAQRSGDLRELKTAARNHYRAGMLEERSELRRDNVDLRHDRFALNRTRADALRDMHAGTQGANDELDNGASARRAALRDVDLTEGHAAGSEATDVDQ
ncbi:MAG: hypothetical protein M0015_17435 [Betaproteobacteria bacterium]|nr:hypothetical protein [Betaproteobacteria bacterium]